MKKIDIYTESFKTKLERFMMGCDSIEEMGLWDKDEFGEMDSFYYNDLLSMILRLIAADGTISSEEVDYLSQNFGFECTVDELEDIYQNCRDSIGASFDDDFRRGVLKMREINEKLADAYRELLILICDIIIESDGVIDAAEIEEAKRLKALV